MTEIIPVIGDWYKKPGGNLFEVVAIDEDDATIEVQHYDGTIEEYELDAWQELLLVQVQPPEDWSGSLDMDPEDYGVDRNDGSADSFNKPLDDLLNS